MNTLMTINFTKKEPYYVDENVPLTNEDLEHLDFNDPVFHPKPGDVSILDMLFSPNFKYYKREDSDAT